MLFDILKWALVGVLVLALVVIAVLAYKHFKNMKVVRAYAEQDIVFLTPGWDNFFIGNIPIL